MLCLEVRRKHQKQGSSSKRVKGKRYQQASIKIKDRRRVGLGFRWTSQELGVVARVVPGGLGVLGLWWMVCVATVFCVWSSNCESTYITKLVVYSLWWYGSCRTNLLGDMVFVGLLSVKQCHSGMGVCVDGWTGFSRLTGLSRLTVRCWEHGPISFNHLPRFV